MSQSTISTFKVFEMFPDAETARLYLESRLWPNGPVCPGPNPRPRKSGNDGGRNMLKGSHVYNSKTKYIVRVRGFEEDGAPEAWSDEIEHDSAAKRNRWAKIYQQHGLETQSYDRTGKTTTPAKGVS